MTAAISVERTRRDQILIEASERRTPIVLSRKEASGWRTFKSRLLGAEPIAQRLIVEYPVGHAGDKAPDIHRGESVGVAFRKGHKKCMFASVVDGKKRFQIDDANRVGALLLRWPTDLQQLQRRVYYRAPVPHDRAIKVTFWRGGVTHESRAGSAEIPIHAGWLMNLSAGGMAVVASSDKCGLLTPGDTVGCRFEPTSGSTLALDAALRHAEPGESGLTRLGFQFIGLELSDQGRAALRVLAHVVSRFQRLEMRRNRLNLPSSRRSE